MPATLLNRNFFVCNDEYAVSVSGKKKEYIFFSPSTKNPSLIFYYFIFFPKLFLTKKSRVCFDDIYVLYFFS